MEASALPASVGLARARLGLGAPLLRLRSDEQLVSLFRAGNEDAFRVIHDRYRARMLAYARQMLSSTSADAEDAVQEVFVRAYAGLRTNRRELALRAWLYRIAHNRCIDELRRPRAVTVEAVEELGEASTDDPVAAVEQREALRRLIADVQRLPEQQRSALLMRELGGMPYADLAGALGVSVPAVKSLLVRARVGLAQASEARDTACSEIREDLIVAHDRGVRASGLARRHLRDCPQCRTFRSDVQGVSRGLGLLLPALGPLGIAAKLLGLGGLGSGSSAAAGSGAGAAAGSTAAGTSAVAGTTAVAGGGAVAGTSAVAGGGVVAGGGALAAAGAGHVVTILAATVVAAGGAIGIQHEVSGSAHHRAHPRAAALVSPAPHASGSPGNNVTPTAAAATSTPSPVAAASIAGTATATAGTTATTPTAGGTQPAPDALAAPRAPDAASLRMLALTVVPDPEAGFPASSPTTSTPADPTATSTDPTETDPTVTDPTTTSTDPTATDPTSTSTDPTATDPTSISTDPTATDPTGIDPTATDPTTTPTPTPTPTPTTTLPTVRVPVIATGPTSTGPTPVAVVPTKISGSAPSTPGATGAASTLHHGNPGTATGTVPPETSASVGPASGGGAVKARQTARKTVKRGAPASVKTVG